MKTNLSSIHRSEPFPAPAFLRSTPCRADLPRRNQMEAGVGRRLVFALTLLACSASAQTWQTVDDFQYAPGAASINFGLTVAPSGIVYASGYASDGTNGYHGLVMASADSGNSW